MDKDFNNFIKKTDLPVLVDFWAEWCGPCKMMAPILSEFSIKYKGRIKVIKVNVDKKPHLSSQYQIKSIPTMILFKDGKAVWREAGARSLSELEYLLASYIS